MVAGAVADAQARLDEISTGRRIQYTIPRADAKVAFRMQMVKNKVVFLFGEETTARSAHRMGFSVVAIPDKPGVAPDRPRRLELLLPPYLLPADMEQAIGKSADPTARISSAERKDEDTGLVCFRLTQDAPYFVANVRKKAKDDRIFLFDPDGPPPTPISPLKYAPFRALFASIREARRVNQRVPFAYELGTPVAWGWDTFDQFLENLWVNYQAATKDLAARSPLGDLPVYFQIDDFRGEFFYSAWKAKSDEQAVNSFDADDDWIHNHVLVRHDTGHPAAQVELAASEFVVEGDIRETLLDEIGLDAEKIAKKFKDSLKVVVDPAELRRRPADALILLSYEDEPPTKGFLTIWPTEMGDLLFTFDSNGEGIKSGMEAHALAPPGDDSFELKELKHYQVIHNFLRAVRLWRTRQLMV